ncbi:hypothetical protein GHT06_014363 [Daphnia sinensis]|uniref:Uncharacterized protein n=1 Tax=Daphnia sinensis TaxID=1820382 RepID=A0AAD5KTN4_9CRUS|nr:hypothetical protein GHT06_014363 [Daphnia sinensis]
MIQFNSNDAFSEEVIDIYFNDTRVKRILKSMYKINSAIALPSMVLLIPILASFMDPSRDYILLLCLGLLPSICICQTSSLIARSAKKNRSVKLLKVSAVLAVCYCVFGILGLISVGSLLVFSSKACERPTCVSDAICSAVLCLITIIGVVYNIIHAKLLIAAIWHNEALEERANSLSLDEVPEDGPISTISEMADGRESPLTSELGFSYLRMENPVEVFP